MFDLKIGELLRQAEAPVPAGAWDAIRAQIAPPTAPPSLGFGAAAMGAAMLLGSLVGYSSLRQDASAAQPQQAMLITNPRVQVEAEAPSEIASPGDNVAEWNADANEPSSAEVVQVIPEQPSGQSAFLNNFSTESNPEVTADAAQLSASKMIITPKIATQLPETLPPALSVQLFQNTSQMPSPESGQDSEAESLKVFIKATNLRGYAPFEIDFNAIGNYDQVDWDFGPLGKSRQALVTRTFEKPGNYTVMLTAYRDNQREMVTDMVTIEIKEGSKLFVPDIITPNGDGLNDVFKAEGINIESFNLMVVNASGKVVFETNNINEPWVYVGGQLTAMEAYFAVINARGVDGKNYSIRQRINISY